MGNKALSDGLIIQATCAVLIDGNVKGTAWLVSEEGYLLTAGHLLGTEHPCEKVEVRFSEDVPRPAYKILWGYQREMGIDFAVLKLSNLPVNCRPLPVSLVRSIEGTFRLCGYGKMLVDLSIGRGEFLGFYDRQNSSANRLFKLDSRQLGQGGYSGGAVVSDELQTVVAVQIAATGTSIGAERDTVLAMPLYRIAKHWEWLETFATPTETSSVQYEVPTQPQGVQVDWGEAPDVSLFFGRTKELETLEQWILRDRCRLVAVLGMRGIGKTRLSVKLGKGGIGKTDLSSKLVEGIQEKFDFVIWKKLLNAPPVTEILPDIIKFFSNQQEIDIPDNVNAQISHLFYYFKERRCLLILDNMEAVLQGGDRPGQYRDGYEGYGELLRQIGEVAHQSCLLLTSREKPQEIARLEGKTKPVRSLELGGLDELGGRKLFEAIGEFSGSDKDWKALIEFYNGNPLALELAAKHISDVFFGDIAAFLEEGKPVFSDLRELLDWHFERLSGLEKEVMYWLAIDREPVLFLELREDLVSPSSKDQLASTLQSLQRRVPLEKSMTRFTLQPVLIEYMIGRLIEQVGKEIKITKSELVEYMTDRFVKQVSEEIKNGIPILLNNHALIKALAKDYVRESQSRLILKPIIEKLLRILGNQTKLEAQLNQILLTLREKSPLKPGYAAGNMLNLLIQLKSNLSNFDFSYLTIWQAYLQGIELHNVNFAHSDLAKSVFTQTFGNLLTVAFSPDGKMLAAGDVNAQIHLWQIENGKKVLIYRGHSRWVGSVIFSPDGQSLASSSDDRTIKLWKVNTGQCFNTLEGHASWIRSVAFSPDGHILASGSDDQTVKLWDTKTGQHLKTLQEDLGRVRSVAFSPDGQTIASANEDHTLRLWDIHTGQCLKTLCGHTGWVYSVAFSPNGQILASGSSDTTIMLWDIDSGQCLITLRGHTNWVWSVAFSPDSRILVSGSYDQTVRLWDVNTGQCLNTLQGHTNQLRSVTFNPDGKTLASGSDDQTLRLWDIKTGQCLNVLQGYSNWIWSVCFNPNGQTLASGGDDQVVRIWSISEARCIKTYYGHTSRIRIVSFSPDSKVLASGSDDRTIRLWDANEDKCLFTLQGHTSWISSIAFSPNGQILASRSDDQVTKFWDLNMGQYLFSLEEHPSWISSIAFSPNDQILAIGCYDQTVRLWNIRDKQCLKTLYGHTMSVSSVVFSPDGKTIASCGEDQTVRIWDVHSGQCTNILQGHTSRIRSIDYSPNGLMLASGSYDQTVKVWDSRDGRCLTTLQGHTNKIRSVAFNSDNQTLASSGEDETIRLWNVRTGDCLKILRPSRPYEGMNITSVTGLTEAQKVTLKNLGAVEI